MVEGNTIEDVRDGALISVDHGPEVKTNAGRVYMALAVDDNTFVWSAAFLATLPPAGPTDPLLALTIGEAGSADPGELLLSAQGNEVQVAGSSTSGAIMQVVAATLNGQATTDQAIALPPCPPRRPTSIWSTTPARAQPTASPTTPSSRSTRSRRPPATSTA